MFDEHAVVIGYYNKVQSNLRNGEIGPRFHSLGGSSNLQLLTLARGLTPNSPFSWGSGTPPNTVKHWTPNCTCQIASKSVDRFKRVHESEVTDDRQTDRPRYGEMYSYGRNRLS